MLLAKDSPEPKLSPPEALSYQPKPDQGRLAAGKAGALVQSWSTVLGPRRAALLCPFSSPFQLLEALVLSRLVVSSAASFVLPLHCSPRLSPPARLFST